MQQNRCKKRISPEEEPKDKGCGGTVFGGLAVAGIALAAVVIRKKH